MGRRNPCFLSQTAGTMAPTGASSILKPPPPTPARQDRYRSRPPGRQAVERCHLHPHPQVDHQGDTPFVARMGPTWDRWLSRGRKRLPLSAGFCLGSSSGSQRGRASGPPQGLRRGGAHSQPGHLCAEWWPTTTSIWYSQNAWRVSIAQRSLADFQEDTRRNPGANSPGRL